MTLVDIRTYVRDYFDLDSEDLPDRLVDRWVSEGWGKIVRFRPNWPGYQEEAVLNVVANTPSYPSPLKDIESVEGPERFLIQLDTSSAERRFIRGGIEDPADRPVAFSVYNGLIRLWPTPSADAAYAIRGQRAAVNPLNVQVTDPIDLPHPDAVEMLVAWVLYRTALRESETETAAAYLDSFTQGMQLLAKDETDSPAFQPIVLNSQKATPMGISTYLPDRLRYDDGWE